MKMTGARMAVEILLEQGVSTVFGYPGGFVLDLYDELYRHSEKIRHIRTAHEQAACHAADGWARASGKTGVVIATSGPGATNLVTGIAAAYLDSTPLVVITGNVELSQIGRDSFQEVDIAGITLPVTKYNTIVKSTASLPGILREAFEIAQSGRPGPVLVDIPRDVQRGVGEFIPGGPSPSAPRPALSASRLKEAAALLCRAERPVIYAGGGVVLSGASDPLLRFAERLDAPIGCSMMGLSAVPHDCERSLGMTGMHGRYVASRALSEADLIIAAGSRFSDRATGNKKEFGRGAKVLHIDIDPAEINKNIPADCSIIGDVGEVLSALIPLIPPQSHPGWMSRVAEMKREGEQKELPAEEFLPRRIIETANRLAGEDTLVATDVGQHQMWTAQYYHFTRPRSFITSGGLGAMGFGMGAAIGACLANGCRKTLLFTGDGSFHMNCSELSTAAALRLPLVIVVMNNGALGMVRQWQSMFYGGRYAETTLARQTDFVLLAQAFGAAGLTISDASEVGPVLEKAFAVDGPVVVDCRIDRADQVLPMIPPGGSIHQMLLADRKKSAKAAKRKAEKE